MTFNKIVQNKKLLACILAGLLIVIFIIVVTLLFLSNREDVRDIDRLLLGIGNDFTIIRHGLRPDEPLTGPRQVVIGADGVSGWLSPVGAVTEADRLAVQIIFETLIAIGPSGYPEGQIANFYIEDDGYTYIFYINESINFSDGSPLLPSDIESSFTAFSLPGVETVFNPYLSRILGWDGFRQGFTDYIEGIVADDYAGIITFNFITNERINKRAFLLPIFRNDLGTGPFALESIMGDNILLAANPNYHGGAPILDYIIIRSANAVSAPLLLGDGIDLFWADYNEILLNQIIPLDDVSIGVFDGIQTGFIGFNQQHPILQNREMRRALSMAVDVFSIVEEHYGEFAAPAGSIIPDYLWLYPGQRERSGFDPAGARRIIEAEGFALGESGFFQRDGHELSFTINTINTYSAMIISEMVAEYWRDIGVRAIVQTLSFSNLRDVIDSENFDVLYMNMNVPHDMDFSIVSENNTFINPLGWHNEYADYFAGHINNYDINLAREAFGRWLEIYEGDYVRLHMARPRRLVFFNPVITGLSPYNFGKFTWNIERWGLSGN